MIDNPKKWKDKVVWAICDGLVQEHGYEPYEVTDSKLVDALKQAGHAPGNPNQRLKYLKEWKLRKLNENTEDEPIYTSQPVIHMPNQEQVKNLQAELTERESMISGLQTQLKNISLENQKLKDLLAQQQQQVLQEIQLLKSEVKQVKEHKPVTPPKQLDVQTHEVDYLRQNLRKKEQQLEQLQEKLEQERKQHLAELADIEHLEGEKKRLQIELAKSKSKQFSNEMQQFTEHYKSFTQSFLNASQQQSHQFLKDHFERIYSLLARIQK